MFEIQVAYKYQHYATMDSWEQTRQLAYNIVLPNTKEPEKLKIDDVMKFPWDIKEYTEIVTEDERKALIERVKQLDK